MRKSTSKTVDEYIAEAPEEIRERLVKIRHHIQEAAPVAEESISYMMPAYKLYGPLVYFGLHKHHIGFYGAGSQMEGMADKIAPYKTSKGALQFPHDQPIPYDLIEEMVKYRVKENEERHKQKMEKKKG